ncbi:hypothetical protein [Streptomyces sp. NPDC094049]|uniref:hypothetical protein n=1 Tax=Streptomyces sp. NPDC094049 TaxID=3154987 RepID=UPI00331854BE
MNTEENIPDRDGAAPHADPPPPGTDAPPSHVDAPAPGTDAPTPHVDAPAPPERPARPRRRALRTLGLIAVAAVLGVVGGTAVGYGVQAEREPTPLPPLNQQDLAQPKPLPKGQKAKPLPASEDLRTKAEGDIRKLLLPKPAGAKTPPFADTDGWLSLPAFVSDFNRPSSALASQLDLGVRRIATTSWSVGRYKRVKIELIQYRAGDVMGAAEYVESQQDYMPDEEFAGNEGTALKGSANGRYYVMPVEREAGYMDFHEARAYFHRGDIAVQVIIDDVERISASEIRSLAERQLARL